MYTGCMCMYTSALYYIILLHGVYYCKHHLNTIYKDMMMLMIAHEVVLLLAVSLTPHLLHCSLLRVRASYHLQGNRV